MNRGWCHPGLLCPTCGLRPATLLIEAEVPVSPWDGERYGLLSCDTLGCLTIAQAEAEANGTHLDTRALTRDDAEELTGLDLGAVAR